ncbi:MAG: cytochrome P450 [Nocardiopsaceae bacterium]|nr:cytochrome P450 [Nocardiopsaceae bacterium]
MDPRHTPVLDRTLPMLANGYAWLPDRWRNTKGPLVRARLLGQHAVALRGPEAVRFFYDERHVRRHTALPEPVRGTLFGKGAVHTLDGGAHRVRKAMLISLLMSPTGIADLVEHTAAAWDEAVRSWAQRPQVVLFDEASRVLTRGVFRWTGIPLDAADEASAADDLVAMVDGFATLGPRHWRARLARRRQEDRLGRLVERLRSGAATAAPGAAVEVVAHHRDADGHLLDPHSAAVELLNATRPAVAISWFVAFSAHALHLWPRHRARLGEDAAYARAFAHEIRRFYPFAPFVGGRAVQDLTWHGHPIPAGALVLLDIYGQNHDARMWKDPYTFDPQRFIDQPPGRDDLIPQGGGAPATGHRCPGEDATIALLQTLAARLARLDYTVPEQNMAISLRRVPARPRSGMVISGVHPPTG